MLALSDTDDSIMVAAKLAFKCYYAGDLDRDHLIEILQKCINARAIENGYVEQFGLPFRGV